MSDTPYPDTPPATSATQPGDTPDDYEPGLSIGFGVKLHAALNSLTSAVTAKQCADDQREQRRLAALPNRVTLPAKTGTAKWNVFDFGGPQLGRRWNLRQWFVADATGVTEKPEALIVIGPPSLTAMVDATNGPNLTALAYSRDHAIAASGNIEAIAGTYSPGAMPIRHGEHLYVVVLSGTPGDVIVCNVAIEDELAAPHKLRPTVEE